MRSGWRGELLHAKPQIDIMKRPKAGNGWGPSGACIGPQGTLRNGTKGPIPAEDVAALQDTYGKEWKPIIDPFITEYWSVLDARLTAAGRVGLVDGGFRAPEAKAYLSISSDRLYGSFVKGMVQTDRDDSGEWKAQDIDKAGGALVFIWDLCSIDKIVVYRARGFRKLRDAELLVAGASPEAALRAAAVSYFGDNFPGSDNSEMLTFAQLLASAVNAARGGSARWHVQSNGREEEHRIDFAALAGPSVPPETSTPGEPIG
jgi:hypothetical protein